MGIADSHLAEVGAHQDEWHRESATRLVQSVRDASPPARFEALRRWAAQPLVRAMICFGADRWPGTDVADDAEWAATIAFERREIATNQAAGIDGGLNALNLDVLDWIEQRIGRWDDPPVHLTRPRPGRREARARGRERGLTLRRRGRPAVFRAPEPTGWALRHPSDHWFRSARACVDDTHLGELLDAQIALLADSYDSLAADPPTMDPADLVVEVAILGQGASGWNQPVATSVLAVTAGPGSVGDRLGLRLVADPAARTLDGRLISVRAGERWLVRADRARDGTIIPRDGSHRLAA